jgi:ABC-type transport system involved in multi-copper enzyme maturation permease subunit
MNPILRKELRSLLRERRGWLVPGTYAALLSGMVYLSTARNGALPGPGVHPAQFGSSMAALVAVMQTLAVALVAPILGAAAISSERERGTWTRLLGAPIARWQIATGKFAATSIYVVLMLLV